MKKILIFGIIFLLLGSFALAHGNGAMADSDNGTDDVEDNKTADLFIYTGEEVEDLDEAELESEEDDDAKDSEPMDLEDVEETESENKSSKEWGRLNKEGKLVHFLEKINDKFNLTVNDVSVETLMNLTKEEIKNMTHFRVKLSNGINSEVKIMPNTASERAIERLNLKFCSEENNCRIELKEVGNGEKIRAAYEVNVEKQSRILGIFKAKMHVQAQVDAETGEVIESNKPWWAFLASESQE